MEKIARPKLPKIDPYVLQWAHKVYRYMLVHHRTA
jgi:hypothetical protein